MLENFFSHFFSSFLRLLMKEKKSNMSEHTSTRVFVYICACLLALANKFDTNIKYLHVYIIVLHLYLCCCYYCCLHSYTLERTQAAALCCWHAKLKKQKKKQSPKKHTQMEYTCAWDLAFYVCMCVRVVVLLMYVCWQSWRWRSMAYRDRMDRTSGWLAG